MVQPLSPRSPQLRFCSAQLARERRQVSRQLRKLNWTTVMENVVGSGLPLAITAAVGVLIGRRLSLRSAIDLHQAVRDLDDERYRVQRAKDLALGRRRQQLWLDLRRLASADDLQWGAGAGGRRQTEDPVAELLRGTRLVADAMDALDDWLLAVGG